MLNQLNQMKEFCQTDYTAYMASEIGYAEAFRPTLNLSQLLLEAIKNQKGSKAVISLLQEGADPNVQDEYQQTPLHIAARQGDLESVRALLANDKTNPNLEDEDHLTPIMQANAFNHRDCAALLQQRISQTASRRRFYSV